MSPLANLARDQPLGWRFLFISRLCCWKVGYLLRCIVSLQAVPFIQHITLFEEERARLGKQVLILPRTTPYEGGPAALLADRFFALEVAA